MEKLVGACSLEDALENELWVKENGCHNYTNNGECSKCGSCCGRIIPLTRKEIKLIRRLVLTEKIEPHRLPAVCMSIDLTCPFLNLETHLCNIYEHRPYICRNFKCDIKPSLDGFPDYPGNLINTDMWDFFD